MLLIKLSTIFLPKFPCPYWRISTTLLEFFHTNINIGVKSLQADREFINPKGKIPRTSPYGFHSILISYKSDSIKVSARNSTY